MALALAATLGPGSASGGPEPAPDAAQHRATFTNPVFAENFPDPQAIKADGAWWAYGTNGPRGNVPVLRSTDLVSWEPAGDAMPDLASWADAGKTWAPEAVRLPGGEYALFYTAAAREAGRQCIGAAFSPVPGGPFRDTSSGPLVCQRDQGGSIDASPYLDDAGRLWLTWKNDGNAVQQDTWLYSARLADDGRSLASEPTRLLSQDVPWEGELIEAPFFYSHGGRLHLFYSANSFASADYAVGYATCESPLGPCAKAPENPVLTSNEHAAGPGHISLVEKDGRTWMLYHAWQPDAVGEEPPGRHLWLDEVTWPQGRPVVDGPDPGPQPVP